jgi:hypothetical protein
MTGTSWNLCVSLACLAKAGVHAHATMKAYVPDSFSEAVEGKICTELNMTVATILTLSTEVKNAVKDACEALIAMDIVCYDNTGYIPREADMIMNKNDERYTQALNVLRKKEILKLT